MIGDEATVCAWHTIRFLKNATDCKPMARLSTLHFPAARAAAGLNESPPHPRHTVWGSLRIAGVALFTAGTAV